MKATPSQSWTEVTHLFEAVLEMSPDDRDAFLERACAGDAELRREVQSLLEADAQAGKFMDTSGTRAATDQLAPGARFGPYEIVDLLGEGGMGQVYRAQDARLGREVAIKVLAPGTRGEEAVRRFEQEARAAGSLNHPNILDVHDIGVHEGAPYIVAELLQGTTLRARMEGKPLPLKTAVDYAIQIAHGLSAAHAKGIVHRDLKPENLFITVEGRLKILDFGIAKLVAREGAAEPLPTNTGGAILGTVGYMSPEQVRGERADPRSDIFSFGALFYEMLSGASAFARASALETGHAILSEDPPALPAHVPPEVDCIARRCLQKDLAKRYPSAKDLLLDLQAMVIQPLAPARSRGRRRTIAWVGLAGALFLALLGLRELMVGGGPQRESARISVAAADFVNETKEEELNGLSGMLITSLEQSKRLSVLTRGRMFDVLKQLGRADAGRIDELLGREICKQARVDALVLASIRRFGELYAIDLKVLDPVKNEYLFTANEQGKGKESIPAMIDRISERARAGLKEKEEEIRGASVAVAQSTTANLEAYQHYFQGQQLYARNEMDKAVPEFRKAVELDPRFALAHLALGDALGWMSDEPPVIEEYETALRLGLPERERCVAETLLASVRGKWDRYIQLSDECAARFPEQKGILFNAGDWRFHSTDLVGAVPYFEKALSIDPDYGPAVEHLLWAWKGLGRADKALELAKAHAARVHDARVHVQLASAQLFAGDRTLAIATLREAARLFPQSPGPALELANAYLFSGEPEKAESELRPVLEGGFAESDPQAALLARLELEMYRGRFRRSVTALDDAAARARKAGGANAIWAGLAYWKAFVLATGPRDLSAAEKIVAAAPDIPPDQLFVLYSVMEDVDRAAAVQEAHPYVQFGKLLDALRAQKRGDRADAIARYEKIAQVPEMRAGALNKLAELHLDAGEPQKALTELRKLQTTYLGMNLLFVWYPRSFYRMGQAHERAGDPAAALEAYRRFLTLWKDADPDLAELQDAKARVAALGGVARK
jgi:tetratricopeptide (TPR) repeat protein